MAITDHQAMLNHFSSQHMQHMGAQTTAPVLTGMPTPKPHSNTCELQQAHLGDVLLRVFEPADGVLHPVLIVALGEVLSRMRSSRLCPLLCPVHRDGRVDQQVL